MPRDFEDHCWKDVIPPDVLEIYAAYRREVHVGATPRCWRSTSTSWSIAAGRSR